jgi:hypothetical protein
LAATQVARAVVPAPDGAYAGFTTAEGQNALFNLTTGVWNTAIGAYALYNNTSGQGNTAVGLNALRHNFEAPGNVAIGANALLNNTSGNSNTGTGYQALYNNTASNSNTAFGSQSLLNCRGGGNTAVGAQAGSSLTTGVGNVDIGSGVNGVAGESNVTRIRNIGVTPQNTAIYVTLDAVGGTKLGYTIASSSKRYKEDIKPMREASEALYSLKPISFRYKPEFDSDRAERFGLIAEEVEKINPNLVTRNERGEIMTVRYDSVNAMLLNEFLKEHRVVQDQEKEIRQLRTELKQQQALIEKISDKIGVLGPAPRLVSSSR